MLPEPVRRLFRGVALNRQRVERKAPAAGVAVRGEHVLGGLRPGAVRERGFHEPARARVGAARQHEQAAAMGVARVVGIERRRGQELRGGLG